MDKTLFIVTHSATDEEYTDNLNFFVKHGMEGPSTGLREYIVVVQQVRCLGVAIDPHATQTDISSLQLDHHAPALVDP